MLFPGQRITKRYREAQMTVQGAKRQVSGIAQKQCCRSR